MKPISYFDHKLDLILENNFELEHALLEAGMSRRDF